jgi:protein TonB
MTQIKEKSEPVAPQLNRQVSKQQHANAEQAYLYELRSEILMHAQDTYPRRAKRRHWEGVVTLSFTLLPSGKILGLSIQESSSRQILDDAATSILQSKMRNQFQPFPAEITRKEWEITIPVSYHLR